MIRNEEARESWIDFKAANGKTDGGPALMNGKQRARRNIRRKMAKESRKINR